MMPACDHTGTPLHFHSSTTSGSACLMRARIRASTSPLQSPSSLILPSISRGADSAPLPSCEPLFGLFMVAGAFLKLLPVPMSLEPHGPLTLVGRAIGWLASPKRRVELRRAGRAHEYRGNASLCSLIRPEGPETAKCPGRKLFSRIS